MKIDENTFYLSIKMPGYKGIVVTVPVKDYTAAELFKILSSTQLTLTDFIQAHTIKELSEESAGVKDEFRLINKKLNNLCGMIPVPINTVRCGICFTHTDPDKLELHLTGCREAFSGVTAFWP